VCGICGAIALEGALDPDVSAAVPRMATALRHRGPDGIGRFADDIAALGHARLAIIDRAGGAQPMSNEDGTCWVTFNGEIYNHRSVRARLESLGHRFRTASDTEVIVHAWEEFGEKAVDLLHGMFAFAVYDQRRRELFLARDRMGKKPLFYSILGGVLHFASEIKALRESPRWDGTIAGEAVGPYFSLGYLPAPMTIYRHVRVLPPGHWLRARGGAVETGRYWDVSDFDSDRRPERAVIEELESLLHTAVRDRLESEVPLGAFLSGGLDSALVVSFMADDLPSVTTTTVAFAGTEHDESDAAGLVASRFGTAHSVEWVEERLDEALDAVVGGFDEPVADSSAIPTWYVAQTARRHVTVALTGDGGDEVFGGYGFRYNPHLMEAGVRRALPWPTLRGALGRVGRAWPGSRRLPRPLRLGAVLQNIAREPEAAYYVDLCFSKPRQTQQLLGLDPDRDFREDEAYDLIVAPYRNCPSAHPLQRAQYADLKGYLPNDVLAKVDRMSMAHGLEVRSPLLDHRVVEFAFKVPPALKYQRMTPKHLLRQLAGRRLPPALLTLPKRGFTAPISAWLAGDSGSAFEAEVLSGGAGVAAFIDRSYLRGAWQAHRAGTADCGYLLWAAWVFERWLRRDHPTSGASN
jgi:asparagine synthase (glutamine-hydrolysing)